MFVHPNNWNRVIIYSNPDDFIRLPIIPKKILALWKPPKCIVISAKAETCHWIFLATG